MKMETIEELYERSDYEFEQAMIKAAKTGNIALIREFVNCHVKKDHTITSLVWHMLESACKNNQASIVQYILETDCFVQLIDKDYTSHNCFQDSCLNNSKKVVEYLLENVELSTESILLGCSTTIEYFHQSLLEFILNHPKSEDTLKYELNFPSLLQEASKHKNVDTMRYLVDFKNLQKNNKSYLYEHAEKTIYFAVHYDAIEIIRFLVCEMDIPIHSDANHLLKSKNKSFQRDVASIVASKNLNTTLDKELNRKKHCLKKNKI